MYAYLITFCRSWYITGEILIIPLKSLTAHFMTKYSILSSFPPYFLRNVDIFLTHRGKIKAHWCSLVLCFLLENIEGSALFCFLKETWWMICHRISDSTGSQCNSKNPLMNTFGYFGRWISESSACRGAAVSLLQWAAKPLPSEEEFWTAAEVSIQS